MPPKKSKKHKKSDEDEEDDRCPQCNKHYLKCTCLITAINDLINELNEEDPDEDNDDEDPEEPVPIVPAIPTQRPVFQLNTIDKNVETLDDLITVLDHKNASENQKSLVLVLKELNQLIGMKQLKQQIINQILFFIQSLNDQGIFYHSVITGNPGTGKTTIINLLSKIYKHMGFLTTNKIVKVDRSDLIGQYLGHTAFQTKKVLESAKGGILLIDEVYSLGSLDNRDSFAKECVDTINQYLSEHVDELVCIIAGYEDEIESYFFKQNKGLKRRFPWKFNIEDYSAEELYQILCTQLGSWKFSIDDKYVINSIKNNMQLFKGNGGDTRILLDRCKINYARRNFRTMSSISSIPPPPPPPLPLPLRRKRAYQSSTRVEEPVVEITADKIITKEDYDKSLEEFIISKTLSLSHCRECKKFKEKQEEKRNCVKCCGMCEHCLEHENFEGSKTNCEKCNTKNTHMGMYS
jgi:SpoVK/Ycf46/Vps4 family AAA+-type ATPase